MYIQNVRPMSIEKPKPSDIIFKQSFTREQLFRKSQEKELFKCQEIAKKHHQNVF